ncbi:MAG TPA: PIN domain-containing protein [Edaphobacter sp.]|jgi:hypothetical protein|nr:PIN domain-containing protein [Edaphobacter sp.]
MRSAFLHFYTPTTEEFTTLWRSATFSFDASVLLDLYRFTQASREELLRLFKQHQDRIWLTHQSGLEFSRNRFTIIGEAKKKAADLKKQLENLRNVSAERYQQHPFVSSEVCVEIGRACNDFLTTLQQAEDSYPNYLTNDPILAELLALFEGKVGEPFSKQELTIKYAEIDLRYAAEIPPGYADAKTKDAPRSYGDCILWFQLIDYSKKSKRPVILVTRDLKEDWWLREGGKTLLPHPELRREFKEETGQDFYLYQASQFIEEAKLHRQNVVSEALLAEARAMSEESRQRKEEAKETAVSSANQPDEILSQALESSKTSVTPRLDNLRNLLELLRVRPDVSNDDDTGPDQSA